MGLRQSCFFFLLVILSTSCSGLFYHPEQPILINPKRYGIAYETLRFNTSDDVMLSAWFFPAKLKRGQNLKGTIVQFHGNGENRSTHFLSLVWLIDEGYNLFSFDYRGYNGSEGSPSQEGTHLDGKAAIEYIQTKTPALQFPDIILYGQSLGGAILARSFEDIQDRSRIQSLVIEGSFVSYQGMAQDLLSRSAWTWLFQWLGKVLISDSYSPQESFSKIAPTPLLVIHGTADPTVPFYFGEKIFELAQEPKTFLKIQEGKHLDTYFIEQGLYRKKLLETLNQMKIKN